jgi:uncharacterized delta-60 repeat protein
MNKAKSAFKNGVQGIFIVAIVVLATARPCYTQGTLDGTFTVGVGADSRVTSAVMRTDGKVVIAGTFLNYNGSSAVRVAQLLRDGNLDMGFNVGGGANAQVNALALATSGKLIVGGQFTTFNGTGRNRIARLNADGTLDMGFNPGSGFNGLVSQVLVQPDGKVLCVGDFTSFNGTGRNRVARLNTDGTLDNSFDPGTGANFFVTSAVLQSDGRMLIGGFFNDYNGGLVIGLARINTDGSLDTSYNFGGSGLNNAVSKIILQADGKALIGGVFTSYNGIGRNRILRTNTNGSLDTGFDPGLGANGEVIAMAVQSDGAVLVGGSFTQFNGVARTRLCRVSSQGTLDVTWTNGANNALNTLLWIPEGKVIAGGLFTSISGSPRNRIVRLNALCTDQIKLLITTDGAGSETSWEIIPTGYAYAAYSGSGLPDNAIVPFDRCLAQGCYQLRVYDSGSDGILDGGYELRSQSGDRIIDNAGNFSNGSVSAIGSGPSLFCLPMGDPKPLFHQRDKVDFVAGNYLVCEENVAVSAEWLVGDQTNDGYDFWIFDPNGSYSYRRFRSHAVSDGFGNVGATRACHMRVNGWFASQHAPADKLLNVRIRTRVNGVNGAFGPAFRFKIDPARAACPLTRLNDFPGDQFESCNKFRSFGPGNFVHARPVSGANKYQFRFQIIDESFSVTRTSNTYFLPLNWVVNPLEVGKTYTVDVRVSFDGGATWCSDAIPPALDPWGTVCSLTINNAVSGPQNEFALSDDVSGSNESAEFIVYPNPLIGDQQLRIQLLDAPIELGSLQLEIFDALGRSVHRSTHAIEASDFNGPLTLDAPLPAGSYLISANASGHRWTSRLLVTR